jgi:hypothetical protein
LALVEASRAALIVPKTRHSLPMTPALYVGTALVVTGLYLTNRTR